MTSSTGKAVQVAAPEHASLLMFGDNAQGDGDWVQEEAAVILHPMALFLMEK